jgi:hypothetical protein
VWDVATGLCTHITYSIDDGSRSLSFSQDSMFLARIHGCVVYVWEPATEMPEVIFEDYTDCAARIEQIAFSTEGEVLALYVYDRHLKCMIPVRRWLQAI